MSTAKAFDFTIEDPRTRARGGFVVTAPTLAAAFAGGAPSLPAVFGDKQPGLRMFRFAMRNGKTGERTQFMGQGETVTEAFGDAVKPAAIESVHTLNARGIQTVMLTGDNRASADAAAAVLGIDHVIAEVLPEDKARTVTALRRDSPPIAMVGDGINDAPALAAADIGIAMATGTDVAMHAAGITLMRGDPRLVVDAIDISRRTYAKIRQGLFWAFVYNIVGIPLAALGLLSPIIAGAAMAFSSVSVVTNALMLRRWRSSANQGEQT